MFSDHSFTAQRDLQGFGITLGGDRSLWLSLIVLIPLAALFLKTDRAFV